MDRIGLFQEMGYISIGDKYVTPGTSEYWLEQILHQITQEKSSFMEGNIKCVEL